MKGIPVSVKGDQVEDFAEGAVRRDGARHTLHKDMPLTRCCAFGA